MVLAELLRFATHRLTLAVYPVAQPLGSIVLPHWTAVLPRLDLIARVWPSDLEGLGHDFLTSHDELLTHSVMAPERAPRFSHRSLLSVVSR
jgi:hypothetical protein